MIASQDKAETTSYGWLPPAIREPDFTRCAACGAIAIGWHERDVHDLVGRYVSTDRWTVCTRHAGAVKRRKAVDGSHTHRLVLFGEST